LKMAEENEEKIIRILKAIRRGGKLWREKMGE